MNGFQDVSAELLRGFAECLELETEEIMKPVEEEFVGQFFTHLSVYNCFASFVS